VYSMLSHDQDPEASPPQRLAFYVIGTCTTAGGVPTATSSRFTPGAEYQVTADHPDGGAYPLDRTTGIVSADGTVAWRWPRAGDPPGRYTPPL